jgi:endonuclease YncB( thermonuclease family)
MFLSPGQPRASLRGALFTVLAAFLLMTPAGAQEQPAPSSRFEVQVRAADAVTLATGKTIIKLWGVEKVGAQSVAFDLKARTALDNAVGGEGRVVCTAKSRTGEIIFAQCNTSKDQDLSLFMIQQGLVTADRQAVYGTVFEDPYIQAEMQAQGRGTGVWGEDSGHGGAHGAADGVYMVSFGFILFLCIIGAFTVLSIIIMRGFQKIIDAQNQNIEMTTRERAMRQKERGIVAIMLDAELKANKSKIEAYCVVYDEMLKALKEPTRTPKYKKAGDIIQKQPALARSVFDRNTDRIDMLGPHVASALINFYAHVKGSPEYANLEPATPVEEAVRVLDEALRNAYKLDELADSLLTAFAESDIIPGDFRA